MKIRANTNFRTGILLAAFLQLGLFGAFPVHAEMTKLVYTENWVLGAEHIGDFMARRRRDDQDFPRGGPIGHLRPGGRGEGEDHLCHLP